MPDSRTDVAAPTWRGPRTDYVRDPDAAERLRREKAASAQREAAVARPPENAMQPPANYDGLNARVARLEHIVLDITKRLGVVEAQLIQLKDN